MMLMGTRQTLKKYQLVLKVGLLIWRELFSPTLRLFLTLRLCNLVSMVISAIRDQLYILHNLMNLMK